MGANQGHIRKHFSERASQEVCGSPERGIQRSFKGQFTSAYVDCSRQSARGWVHQPARSFSWQWRIANRSNSVRPSGNHLADSSAPGTQLVTESACVEYAALVFSVDTRRPGTRCSRESRTDRSERPALFAWPALPALDSIQRARCE